MTDPNYCAVMNILLQIELVYYEHHSRYILIYATQPLWRHEQRHYHWRRHEMHPFYRCLAVNLCDFVLFGGQRVSFCFVWRSTCVILFCFTESHHPVITLPVHQARMSVKILKTLWNSRSSLLVRPPINKLSLFSTDFYTRKSVINLTYETPIRLWNRRVLRAMLDFAFSSISYRDANFTINALFN